MIIIVNAENRSLFGADLVQMCRQRKAVFVDAAGWKIPVLGDMEMDAYDRRDTIYLLAKHRPDGQVLASVRLLTTTGPHLMCELFNAAERERMPRGATVWEASRFCTAPGVWGRDRRHALLWEIICGVIETGLLYGIDEVIFAANGALLPLALNCGWEARTLGPRLHGDEDEVTAAAAAITTVGLREMRQRHGIPIPVTRLPAIALPVLDRIEEQPAFGRTGSHPLHSAWRHLWRGHRSARGEARRG